jgi:hypothetical protein
MIRLVDLMIKTSLIIFFYMIFTTLRSIMGI